MKRFGCFLTVVLLLTGCKSTSDKGAKASDLPESVQVLYKDIARYPDSMALRVWLVDQLDSLGAYAPAIAQTDSMLQRDSTNFGIWFRRAQLLEHARDTAAAIAAYTGAVKLYPSPDAQLSLASLLAEQKQFRAVELCDAVESLRLSREYLAHCSFIKGVYYARTGDLVKAFASFDRCIGNNYQYIEAYMEKAFLYYDTEQLPKALSVLEQAQEVRPTDPDVAYWLGKCQEKQGNREQAIMHYSRARTLDPQLKEAESALERLGAGH